MQTPEEYANQFDGFVIAFTSVLIVLSFIGVIALQGLKPECSASHYTYCGEPAHSDDH